MATLRKGTVFVQSYPGCSNPITFEVLEIDREKDYLKVNCTCNGYSYEEEWQGRNDGLEFTEMAIDMGEYRIINEIPKDFIYFSLVLTQDSVERLENLILQNKIIQGIIQKREKTIKKYLHHCTLLHKEGSYPSSIQLKTYLYIALKEIFEKEIEKIWKIKVIGWGWNNKALALLVDKNSLDFPRYEGHKYHITVCTFNGGRPVESNNISVWNSFDKPIEVDCVLIENISK